MHSFLNFSKHSSWLAMGWKREAGGAARSRLDSTKEEGTCPRPCEKSVAELYRCLEPPSCRMVTNKSALTSCGNEVVSEWAGATWWEQGSCGMLHVFHRLFFMISTQVGKIKPKLCYEVCATVGCESGGSTAHGEAKTLPMAIKLEISTSQKPGDYSSSRKILSFPPSSCWWEDRSGFVLTDMLE